MDRGATTFVRAIRKSVTPMSPVRFTSMPRLLWLVGALCFAASTSVTVLVYAVAAGPREPKSPLDLSQLDRVEVRWGRYDPSARIKGKLYITVDLEKLVLTVYVNGEPYKKFPVAIGKYHTPTPVGEFTIVDKQLHPGGPFGSRWMGLNVPWGRYGIHGTNRPGSIGSHASMGCIRMYNEDIEDIFDMIPVGTKVLITGYEPRAYVGRSLRKGDVGEDVQYLQFRLRRRGFDPGPMDGYFGSQLEAAVLALQSYYGLPQTGEVGEDELYALGIR